MSGGTIQVVCVWWGTRYTADDVNRLNRNVRAHTASPIRFVAITEHSEPTLDDDVEQVRFPEFTLPFSRLTSGGAHAKLSVFRAGLLDPDLPAIFFDLDTAIFGDVRRLADEIEKHPGNIHMVQNAMVPLWRVQKQLRPVLGARHYYANSSIMAFMPRERSFIFDAFNSAIAYGMDPCPRHLRTDDRFISLTCKDQLRVIPNWLAVKFTEEYMLPFPILEDVRRQLPGIAARRRGLVAITFNGFMPAKLRQFKEGDLVKRRGVKVHWPDAALSEYWR